MQNYCLVDLNGNDRHGYVIGTRLPKDAPAFSAYLDVGFNRQDKGWQDQTPHVHTASEEFFAVVNGRIDLSINDEIVPVEAGHLVGVRRGVPHQVVAVTTPVESFLIRVPGGGQDKILAQTKANSDFAHAGLMQVDLQSNYTDYPLGACLPCGHANYSTFIDFTCVWEVDPNLEWHGEIAHYHQKREEYYIVLKGTLEFEIDGNRLNVGQWQALGVKQGALHRVLGGVGPVNILFVRVPGGRGDKALAEDQTGPK